MFDDFYACAQALVTTGYTKPERLAIEGRSNGGLLMGAALVQHPEMYRAVVSGVGIYDMLGERGEREGETAGQQRLRRRQAREREIEPAEQQDRGHGDAAALGYRPCMGRPLHRMIEDHPAPEPARHQPAPGPARGEYQHGRDQQGRHRERGERDMTALIPDPGPVPRRPPVPTPNSPVPGVRYTIPAKGVDVHSLFFNKLESNNISLLIKSLLIIFVP